MENERETLASLKEKIAKKQRLEKILANMEMKKNIYRDKLYALP